MSNTIPKPCINSLSAFHKLTIHTIFIVRNIFTLRKSETFSLMLRFIGRLSITCKMYWGLQHQLPATKITFFKFELSFISVYAYPSNLGHKVMTHSMRQSV